jgi:hypothetical protein
MGISSLVYPGLSNKIVGVGKSAPVLHPLRMRDGSIDAKVSVELQSRVPRRMFVKYKLKWKVFCFQENFRDGSIENPYYKPTQVGELSIQRRSRELFLRNSAIQLDVS